MAGERSRAVGHRQRSDDIRWIRGYVLDEGDGRVGTVCIYPASSPEAVREHATRAEFAAYQIIAAARLRLLLSASLRDGAYPHGDASWHGVPRPIPGALR